MPEDNKDNLAEALAAEAPVSPVSAAPQPEFLSTEDKHVLDLIKLQKALATSNAEKAAAQNETMETKYQHIVLQLSVKYSLTENDIITDKGEIKRNYKEGK